MLDGRLRYRCANHSPKERPLNLSTVLILSYHFHPAKEIGARRVTALARYLADRGIRVVVVSAFGEASLEYGTELLPGVIAIPVKRPQRPWLDLLVALKRRVYRNSAGSPPKTAMPSLRASIRESYFRLVYFVDDYKKWAWQAARAAVRAGREYDATLILASGPPHSALLAGAWAAGRLGIPYIADLRDPWSDVIATDRPQRRVELRVVRMLERWVLRTATAVTSTSATAASLLTARDGALADRMHVIRNGYDGALAPPLAHTGGRLSILFAGVLYVRRTPFPLLAALEELLSRPDVDPARIRVTFMGAKVGQFSDRSLETWIQGKRCAAVVRILPEQTAAAVAQEVAQATVLLNLAQQQHLHVPAKTYEHLAGGREVLLICEDDCETAQLVNGIRGVIQVDQSNPELLAEVLRDLYNRHVVAGTPAVPAEEEVRRFSRAVANERFHAVLSSAVARRDPRERESLGRQFLSDARFYQRLSRLHGGRTRSLARTMLCNRGLWLLTFHRAAYYCVRHRNVRAPIWWCARALQGFGTPFSVLLCRSDLSGDCEISGPAYLSNRGYLICGARSIGEGSLIHDRCTLGYAVASRGEGRPVIGRNVWIGPNCIIGGPITVGDGATVLPGSFLTYSVPPGAVVKGNPAAIIRRDFDNSALRSSLALIQDIVTNDP